MNNRKEYFKNYNHEVWWPKIKERKRLWFEENGPCGSCGSWDDLELDHIDPLVKITHIVWGRNEGFRTSELAKCQVLCQDCHKEKTRRQKMVNGGHNSEGYKKGCRCDICRDAQRDRARRYRKSKNIRKNRR